MRVVIAAGLMLVAPLAGAGAAERIELAVPGGLAALERADGIAGGLSPPPGPVVAVGPDGRRFAVSMADGRLVLSPTDARSAAPQRANMLPDGEITQGGGAIAHAWLTGPTERYAHGILGDRIEASGLAVERSDGTVLQLDLSAGSVFEDRRARLYDLDGDGSDEIIAVQSFLRAGAALTVVQARGDTLEIAATGQPIGSANRWLNPAAAGDFDGDGRTEIAYVETPHIGGTLKLFEYQARRLIADGAAPGFSNHAIGSREQDLAAVTDWNGDGIADLLVPDARRQQLRIVTFARGTFQEIERIDNSRPIATAVLAALLDPAKPVMVVYGLADGTVVVISPSAGR